MPETSAVLRPARRADIAFIMATERRPGFELLVSHGNREEHLRCLAASDYAYFIGTNAEGTPEGFAILRDLDNLHGNVYLRRIAVAEPGRGFGGALLDLVIDWVFRGTDVYRFWLDALADNARARHVYRRHGISEEGLLRGAYKLPDGRRVDLVVMSLTRPEWAARAMRTAK